MPALSPGDVVLVPVPNYERKHDGSLVRIRDRVMKGRVVRRSDNKMRDQLGRYIVEVPSLNGRVWAKLGEMVWLGRLA